MVVKVPQIINIVRSGTAGLSSTMYAVESAAYAIVAAFHFRHQYAFSTYGEGVFVLVQNCVILLLIARAAPGGAGVAFVAAFAAAGAGAAALFSDAAVPVQVLDTLQMLTIPIFASSRVPQIVSNFSKGSTGSLSVITVFMQFAGSCARIFTTLQEVDDQMVLLSYVIGAALNGVMLFQIFFYWSSSAAGKAQQAKKKKKRTKKTQ